MSVILKDVEMPERCGQCFLRVGNCKQRIYMEQRPKNCPLVEIPTPHGRLIDADELKSRLVLDNDSNELQRISADILKWIDIQETVIEGSETWLTPSSHFSPVHGSEHCSPSSHWHYYHGGTNETMPNQ